MFLIDIMSSSAKVHFKTYLSYSSFWNEHLARLEQWLSVTKRKCINYRDYSQLQNVSSLKSNSDDHWIFSDKCALRLPLDIS